MAKIGQSLSFTFRVGEDKLNQFCKISLDISEIDTAMPIEPQLIETKEAIAKLWKHIYSKVDEEIAAVLER